MYILKVLANKFLEWWKIVIAPDWHWDAEYSQLEYHSMASKNEMQEKYCIMLLLLSYYWIITLLTIVFREVFLMLHFVH